MNEEFVSSDQTQFSLSEPILESSDGEKSKFKKLMKNKKFKISLIVVFLFVILVTLAAVLISRMPKISLPQLIEEEEQIEQKGLSEIEKKIAQIKSDLLSADPVAEKLPFPQILETISP